PSAGPTDGDHAPCRTGWQKPDQRQLRVPEALRGHEPDRWWQRLPQAWRRLGRSRLDNEVAGINGHCGYRLLRMAVPPDAGTVDDADDEQAVARSVYDDLPLQPGVWLPAARWH